MARQTLTDIGVAKLKPKAARYNYTDPNLPGHYVRVTPTGAKTFAAIVRNPAGKQELITIGDAATLPIAESRARARVAMQRVKDGLPAFPPPAVSFGSVAMEWVVRKAEPEEFRSLPEIRRQLAKNILPRWNDLEITSIGKTAISGLLDKIQDECGARQADWCLTVIRMILRWHASRVDGYNPPLFIGMRRQSAKKQRRSRTLDDHEIRRVWAAADQSGTYGALIKTLILTGQRLDKVQTMFWSDLIDGKTRGRSAPNRRVRRRTAEHSGCRSWRNRSSPSCRASPRIRTCSPAVSVTSTVCRKTKRGSTRSPASLIGRCTI